MGVITFGGVSSSTYGIEVETYPDYSVPEKKYEIIHVPGHNGDFLIDTGEYSNVIKKYSISLGKKLNSNDSYITFCNRLSEWLHRNNGYLELSDDYDPAHFRYAVCTKETGLTNIFNEGGKATIEFNCKPQRYLKYWTIDGTTYWANTGITFTASGNIINPTVFDSRPLLKTIKSQNGSGAATLTISNLDALGNVLMTYTIEIAEHTSRQCLIDCDLMDCYSGTTPPANLNGIVTLTNGFPIFGPGTNSITITGDITSLEVKPRFWTL